MNTSEKNGIWYDINTYCPPKGMPPTLYTYLFIPAKMPTKSEGVAEL